MAVGAADLDGDGSADLLVSSLKGGSVTVYQGAAGGELSQLAELTASGAYDATAADLTGDGVADVAVAASSDGAVDVFTGSCGE